MVARRDISQEILVARHKFLVAPGRRAGDFASTEHFRKAIAFPFLTWLNPSIPDSCINIHDFNLVRKDRSGQRGGGVCAFVKSNIPFVPLPDLCCPDHESLWLKLRPYRLPREYSCIVVGLVYHPPQAIITNCMTTS